MTAIRRQIDLRRVGLLLALAIMAAWASLADAQSSVETQGERVPSAQLEVTGSGRVTLEGRLAATGSLSPRSTVVITDRKGDATAFVSGRALPFRTAITSRVRTARLNRAAGILYVNGSNVQVRVVSNELTFSVAGVGRARLQGRGDYRLNGSTTRTWPRTWITLAPPQILRRIARRNGRTVETALSWQAEPVERNH